jgi:tetratricopeptide (TPR) repeat protein
MTTTPPAESQTQSQSAAPSAPGFETAAQAFWDKNRNLIFVVCVAVLAAIIGREGWQYFAAQREKGVRADYAKAGDRPEQLAVFAANHGDHVLGAVANLRIADAKYAAGDYRAATDAYAKAAASLDSVAFIGRARLGGAISQIRGGDLTAGPTALKTIAADTTLLKSTRAEATYHQAVLAYEAKDSTEVDRLIGEITKLDDSGIWVERASALHGSK